MSTTLKLSLRISTLLLAAMSAALVPALVYADGQACTGGSQLEQNQCLGKQRGDLDRELNRIYKLALQARPEQDNADDRKSRAQLRKSQRAWLVYKRENCALQGGLQGGSNAWVSTFAGLCEKQELADRIEFLKKVANGAFDH